MNHARRHLPHPSAKPAAFTLIELMVVIGIIVILAAVSIPAITSLTKNNAQTQAVNQIRSYLAYARSLAISQHRQVGVVFFNETPTFSNPFNSRQAAMQIFVQDYNQNQYNITTNNGVVYVANSNERQYLPAGVTIATLNIDTGGTNALIAKTGENSSGMKVRAVLFDGSGQMIIQNNMATPDTTGSPGSYPMAYGDWMFTTTTGAAGTNGRTSATSTGLLLVYNQTEYNQQNFPTGVPGDTQRSAWINQHADIIVINPYTGNAIR